jgi:TIR domain
LGSIFDEECDLLVIGIPVSDTVGAEMQKVRVPLPQTASSNIVTLAEVKSDRFGRIAYAITGYGYFAGGVRNIGAKIGSALGEIARQSDQAIRAAFPSADLLPKHAFELFARLKPFKVAAPLLRTEHVVPRIAALALAEGFVSAAPDRSVLVISVQDWSDYEAISEALRNWSPTPQPAERIKKPSAPGTSAASRLPKQTRDAKRRDVERPLTKPASKRISEQPVANKPPKQRATTPDPSSQKSMKRRLQTHEAASETSAKKRAANHQSTGEPVTKETITGSGATPKRNRVFISYSHADAEWLERLQKHLRPLERQGVAVWEDTRLRPGSSWRKEIRAALAETKVAILLISADFLASDFIVTDELPPLLKAAENDGATILPVIISPSRFERMESLSRFQAVNDPRKPLVQLRRGNREKVLDEVARAVEDALKR